MRSPSINSILFNVAGGLVLLTVAGYIVSSLLFKPKIELCSARYPTGFQLTYDGPEGQPLNAIDLQARSGAREWGLLKNASVISKTGPSRESVLEVQMASLDDSGETMQNGVGFTWQPHELTTGTSACLSYSVYLPADFKFQERGLLPGIFGAADVADIDGLEPDAGFAVRVGWGQGGDAGVDVRSPASHGYWENPPRKTLWPVGRWVSVEQEVQLNAPGADDGILRLWIDGALTIDRKGILLRKNAQTGLTGVISDIGYERTLGPVARVRVSPFILRWQ